MHVQPGGGLLEPVDDRFWRVSNATWRRARKEFSSKEKGSDVLDDSSSLMIVFIEPLQTSKFCTY